ncbi:MAG: hypothetical protein HC824_07185 [Synechococcales cyanobacterium RM1_1_8]|nr:hypothetical protein [Synechococcales cyanobacterium RM1_1_8]
MPNFEASNGFAAPISPQASNAATANPYGLDTHGLARPAGLGGAIAFQPDSVSPESIGGEHSSATIALDLATQGAYDALIRFSQGDRFAEQMSLAFGAGFDLASSSQFFQALQAQGAIALPKIELVEGDALNQAYGVYAQRTDTVYLSRQFLTHGAASEQVKVLLEEIGHSLDVRTNSQDAAGDEGDIFSRIVLGEEIAALELAQLKAEDDSAILHINGQILAVEMNGTLPAVGVTSGASVSEALFNGRIYQTVRGTDSLIYSRSSGDRLTWTSWQQFGGTTPDSPELQVFNNRLYQSVRGIDNLIYLRSSADGQTWTAWQQFGGATLDRPALAVFNNQLHQTVRGTDNRLYWRSSSNGEVWAGWQGLDGLTLLGSPQLTNAHGYLTVSALGSDNQLHYRYSSNGVTWTPWNAAPPAIPAAPAPDSDSGFNIEFDYRFDTNGWFTPERRAALEAAADVWEEIILDDFATTPVGTRIPFVMNPQTNADVDFIADREIDDLLIFVGARSFNGSTLGVAGPSGYVGGDPRYTGNDFEPRAGSIAFSNSANWFFDATPGTSNDIPTNRPDFISTAVHEIGHVLGFSRFLNAFSRHVDAAGNFAGPNARARNGGNPIPLNGSHIQDGYEFGGSGESVLDPISFTGTRQLPTVLDIAIFDDIGYGVNYSRASQNRSSRSSGSIIGTGLNDRLANPDDLLPSHCQCASCCRAARGLNQLGDGSLAALIAA